MWSCGTWSCDLVAHVHVILWHTIVWSCGTWSCDLVAHDLVTPNHVILWHMILWHPIMWSCGTWSCDTWLCDLVAHNHVILWHIIMWSCGTWSCDVYWCEVWLCVYCFSIAVGLLCCAIYRKRRNTCRPCKSDSGYINETLDSIDPVTRFKFAPGTIFKAPTIKILIPLVELIPWKQNIGSDIDKWSKVKIA